VDAALEKALELKPGATYAVELDFIPCAEEREAIGKFLETAREKTGCKFVVLVKGVRIARAPEDVEENHF